MSVLLRAACAALLFASISCAAPDGTSESASSPTSEAGAQQAATPGDAATSQAAAIAGAPDAELAISFESWARRLVDPAAGRHGERDTIVADWFALLAEEPSHPLAEGTLVLLGAVEPDLERPQEFRAALLALDPEAGFTPIAAGRLRDMQARARSRSSAPDADAPQRFTEHADRALVLGPLGPASDPLALTEPRELFTSPNFGGSVPGLDGEPRVWRPLERSGELGRLQVSSVLADTNGWLMLAIDVELPGGGPGFLELDLGGSAGSSSAGGADQLFAFGGSNFRGFVHGTDVPPPSFGWSLNGAPPGVIDMGLGERSGCVLLPVVFRDGVNRVLWRMLGSGVDHFSVRALSASGDAWQGATWLSPGAELGRQVAGAPPQQLPVTSASVLQARASRGACENALLGLLLLLDRQPAQGLQLLELAADGTQLGPKALLAGVLDRIAYVPASVRRSRARQREDEVLALDPHYFSVAVSRVEQWLAEDRELDALESMRELTELHTGQARGLLRLHALLESLSMPSEAERVLQRALDEQPDSPGVLERVAESERRYGARSLALDLEQRALELNGRSAGALEQLALRRTGEGQLELAEALWHEALERLPSRTRQLRYARWLSALDRPDEARARLEVLRAADPYDLDVAIALADLELLRGNRAAEREALHAALEIAPGLRALRLRLAGDPEKELVRAAAARWLISTDETLREFDSAAQRDSVVKLVDQAYVHVFEDGVVDTITHDILQLRDLDAVTRNGERSPPGEVIALATLKADGRRFEPVLVGGSYVMPNLKPGDFIEQVTRASFRVPPGFAMRPGGWFFQSTEMPFLRSRYVVSLPRDHSLRLELRSFEGSHDVHVEGDREVHVFEALDMPRLQRERGAPPNTWILPMAEFGEDDDLQAEHHRQLVLMRAATEPSPEVVAKVHEITRLLPGEQLKARALFAFVQDHLQQRWPQISPASAALLTGEGNAAVLYASMLRAAGIDHELIFTRDVAPAADPEPEPDFLTAGRVTRKLLVSVIPSDGPAVFCDLEVRSQPYGQLLGDAPGAEAMVLGSGRRFALPESSAEATPGQRVELRLEVADDGSAQVTGKLGILGPTGFAAKSQFREMPDAYLRATIGKVAAQVVEGLDLGEAWVVGLDEGNQRMGLAFDGSVPRFIEASASDSFERPLPMPGYGITAAVTSEGERRLPFLSTELNRQEFVLEIALGESFELAEPLPELNDRVAGLRYLFEVEQLEGNVLRLHRVMSWEPFLVSAEEHAELEALAARIDELERGRLRLRRR